MRVPLIPPCVRSPCGRTDKCAPAVVNAALLQQDQLFGTQPETGLQVGMTAQPLPSAAAPPAEPQDTQAEEPADAREAAKKKEEEVTQNESLVFH